MKIIFLLATRNFGGAQRSSLELANRLQSKHDVLIVEMEGSSEAYMQAITNFGLSLKQYEGKINFKGPLRKLATWYFWSKWLGGIFKERQPDVIIVKDTKTLSLLSRKANYIICFYARAWYATYQISLFKRSTFKIAKPYFIAVSQATRHALFNAGVAPLERISVLPNVLNLPLQFKRKAKTDNKLRLLHAGGFISTKGQHITLEVASRLKAAGIPFKLTLVGFIYKTPVSKQYFNNLEKYVKINNLQNDVILIRDINNLEELYLENDVLLYPSMTEGLPRVIMEAMHYKLAVIANPVGGVIDLLQDGITGFIADYNNVSVYSQIVEELYRNSQLRERIGENASVLIQNGYTAENQMSKIDFILSKWHEYL